MANLIEITVRSRDETGKGMKSARGEVRGFAKDAEGASQQAQGAFGELGRRIAEVFVLDRVVNFAQGVRTAASSLEQSVGGTEAVFGEARQAIDDYAANSAEAVGLSERAFRDLSTVAGAQLKNLGFSVEQAADKSIQLTEIGADLAATYGGTTAEAVEALGAAFRGEADPAERFGLRLNINTANAKAVELGLADSTSAVDDHARAQAVLALIMEQSADAQGQFGREADTAAGKAQIASAKWEDMQAKIGQKILPVINAATGAFISFADTAAGPWVIGLGAAAAAVIALVGPVKMMIENARLLGSGISGTVGGIDRLKGAAAAAAGAAGVAALVVGIKRMADASREAQLDELAEQLAGVTDTSDEAAVAAIGVAAEFGNAGAASERLNGLWERTLEMGAEQAERFLELAEAAGVGEDKLDEMRSALENKREADAQATVDQERNTAAIEEGADALQGEADAAEDATDALQAHSDALKAQFDPLFGMISANQQMRDARNDVTAAEMELAAAVREHGRNSLEAMSAQEALTDARIAAGEAAYGQEQALATLALAVENEDVTIEEARAGLQRWIEQAGLTGAEALTLMEQFNRLTGEARDYADGSPYSADAEVDDNATRRYQYLGGVADRWGRRQSSATANLRDNASESLISIASRLGQIDGRVVTAQAVIEYRRRGRATGGRYGLRRGGIKGAQAGGIRNDLTLVGEGGPELVDLPPGSMVHPAGRTRAWLEQASEFAQAGIGRRMAAGGIAGPVRWGTVSQQRWDQLMAMGWRGHPGDQMEALYAPKQLAGMPVRRRDTPRSVWDHLRRQGWRGRAGDNMEALYAPGTQGVTVNLYAQGSILAERDVVRIIRDEFLNGGFEGVGIR